MLDRKHNKTIGFSTCGTETHNATSAFSTVWTETTIKPLIFQHFEPTGEYWNFRPRIRRQDWFNSNTNGFTTFGTENTIKPMVFTTLWTENVIKPVGCSTCGTENIVKSRCFKILDRKHNKTHGFSPFWTEHTVRPMLFRHFLFRTARKAFKTNVFQQIRLPSNQKFPHVHTRANHRRLAGLFAQIFCRSTRRSPIFQSHFISQ